MGLNVSQSGTRITNLRVVACSGAEHSASIGGIVRFLFENPTNALLPVASFGWALLCSVRSAFQQLVAVAVSAARIDFAVAYFSVVPACFGFADCSAVVAIDSAVIADFDSVWIDHFSAAGFAVIAAVVAASTTPRVS